MKRIIVTILAIVIGAGWLVYHKVLPTGRAKTSIQQLRTDRDHTVTFRNLRKSEYFQEGPNSRGKVCGELKIAERDSKTGPASQGDFTRFVFEEFEIDGVKAYQFSLFPVNQASIEMLKTGFVNAEQHIQYSDNYYKKVCLNAQ